MGDAPQKQGKWQGRVRTLFNKISGSDNIVAALITSFAALAIAVVPFLFNPTTDVEQEVEYGGQVINNAGRFVSGATVSIMDERGQVQVSTTDSVGRYRYYMKPSTRSAHFIVTADNYEPYTRDLLPSQTGRAPFILTPLTTPTPTPTTTPAATPQPTPTVEATPEMKQTPKPSRPKKTKPTPCSVEDILRGKC